MSERRGRRSIEDRLADAGLPPLPRTAWLEIDLDALASNLAVVRALGGDVPVHTVVKADAYGHGAVPVTRALETAGADGFCVAVADEALELRAGGIRGPILVLYPVPAALVREAADLGIAVSIGDPDQLADLVRALGGRAGASDRPLAVHLEVETGLGRGGFLGSTVVDAALAVAAIGPTRLEGLWTHLQAVEDPELTRRQMAAFDDVSAAVVAAGVDLPRRHVAASAGLIADGVAALGGTRPGLSIYGIVPDELVGAGLPAGTVARFRPVMALHARPVRVMELPVGWGVSYGPTFTTTRPSRIATLPIGYGDGWARQLSNRATVLVRGRRVPLVGNVAMDAVMADVTDVPGSNVTADDEFTFIGAQGVERIGVEDLARDRTTNTWEVVTAMARRLPRVYHAASGLVAVRTLTTLTETPR